MSDIVEQLRNDFDEAWKYNSSYEVLGLKKEDAA